jgi:hypothetical protein
VVDPPQSDPSVLQHLAGAPSATVPAAGVAATVAVVAATDAAQDDSGSFGLRLGVTAAL